MHMHYNEVVKLLARWKIAVVPKEAKRIRGHDVDTFRALARQTERIDYDCDFNNGRCQGRMMCSNGCCAECARAFGHWRKEGGTIDEDTLRRVAGYYDERLGFLREGEGCILPRELRSPICLYVRCSDEMMTDEDKILLARIQFGAHMK